MIKEDFHKEQSKERQLYGLTEDDQQKMVGQFPDKKYYEFINHIWLENKPGDVLDLWNQWLPYVSDFWTYPIKDLVRYKKMLVDNQSLIKDKRIADIGSDLGFGLLLSLHLGAKHCIGLEPVVRKNELASLILDKAGYGNFTLFEGQIKDQDVWSEMKDLDTVILGSVLDVIADHYRLIENVAKTKAQDIIIDGREDRSHAESETPWINWKVGRTPFQKGSFNDNVQHPFYGEPNRAFVTMLMAEFGYQLDRQSFYEFIHFSSPEPMLRSVSIYSKKEGEK